VYGLIGVGVYGCMSVSVYQCMGVWVYGCMGVWVYGCMGVWVYKFGKNGFSVWKSDIGAHVVCVYLLAHKPVPT
jgi:hypothetical protein